MPLTWDLTKIKNVDEVCWLPSESKAREQLNPVTNALIWAALIVGLPEITAKNVDEWLVRLEVFDQARGPLLLNSEGRRRRITRDDLEAHIGLTTNASRFTRTQYLRHISRLMEAEANRTVQAELQRRMADSTDRDRR